MGPNMMLPLLLMDDDGNNEDLLFMLMMNQNREAVCEPAVTTRQESRMLNPAVIPGFQPRSVVETRPAVQTRPVAQTRPAVFQKQEATIRHYKINSDGSKIRINKK